MEKLDKKKVLAVVIGIALVLSLMSVVSLLYNAIDMFIHDPSRSFHNNVGLNDDFMRWQGSYAIITLFAFACAALGTGAGIASFAVKNAAAKKACTIIALCAAGAMLILTIAAVGVNFSNEAYRIEHRLDDGYMIEEFKYPYGVYGNSGYVIYSEVMAALLQQLVLSVIIAVALLVVFIIDNKAKKLTFETEDINLENKGE